MATTTNPTPRVVITRDGEPRAIVDTPNDAFAWLLRAQGQSVEWAMSHEGWAYAPAEPWPATGPDEQGHPDRYANRRQLAAMARHTFYHGGHAVNADNLTRANCGACVLEGYKDTDDDEHDDNDGPNYAGWARVYVEAGRPIPARWADAFERERRSDNVRYAAALERSIATWGVRFEFTPAERIAEHTGRQELAP